MTLGNGSTARRWTHSSLGLTPQRRTPGWGWSKTQLGQGVIPGKLLMWGGKERNAVRATESALQLKRQASGLLLQYDRSMLKLRTGYCC